MKDLLKNAHVMSFRNLCAMVLVSILSFETGFSQQDLTLYNMEMIPQRMYQNPALKPFANVNIGLPLISSEYFNVANTGFKYSQLIRKRADDSLYVDMDNMISKLGKR